MRVVGPSSEPEMIAGFLQQEFASTDRYDAKISAFLEAKRVSSDAIPKADISSGEENANVAVSSPGIAATARADRRT